MADNLKHICGKCNKEFSTVSLLNRHVRKQKIPCNVEDRKQYISNKKKCQYCERILCTYNNLRNHENICKSKPKQEPVNTHILEVPNKEEEMEIMKMKFDELTKQLELQNKQMEIQNGQMQELLNKQVDNREYIDNKITKFSEENKKLRQKLNSANIYIASKRRVGQTHFRKELLQKFDNKCIITETKCESELEACHIVSINKGGTYDLDNGILLKRNLHTTFDKYMWSINPYNMRICVGLEEEIGEIKNFADTFVDIPINYTILKNLDEHYKEFINRQQTP
jgi:predicted restriction endonuclease